MNLKRTLHTQLSFCILLTLSFLFFSSVPSFSQGLEHTTYQSMIVVKVPQMNRAQYNDITSEIAKNNQMIFEYACQESGIVVVKYYHNYQQKPDVQTMIIQLFREWTKVGKIDLIYLDIKEGNSSKC